MAIVGEFFDAFGGENLFLVAAFVLSFSIFIFAMNKTIFKKEKNKALSGIIAFVLATLFTFGIYRSGFDLGNLFYGLGLESGLILDILYLLIAAGVIYIIYRIGRVILLYLGGALVFAAIFGWVYEQFIVAVIGIVLILIYLSVRKKEKKDPIKLVIGS